MDNPFAQFVNTEADPIVQPAVTPRQQAEDGRRDRSIQIQEERFQYQQQRDRAEDERREREAREKEKLAQSAQQDAAYTLRNTIEKIDEIKADATDSWTGVAGLGETGLLGSIQSGVPGSAAYSMRKDLGTIDATQVLQAMTRLKELSPTGSTGFGALSAPELELLKSSVARLDPDMDQETFMENLNTARRVYTDMLLRIEGGGKSASELLTDALRDGKSKEEILRMAKIYGIEVNETDLDMNLRAREQGVPTNEVLPPDIDAIMKKYGG